MVQAQCHTYFMDVISKLCFGTAPNQTMLEELMLIAFDDSERSLHWHRPNQPQTLGLQAFLLGMLLKYG